MTGNQGSPDDLRAGLAHVEALPLGAAVILHNRESGALVASNAFGGLLIDRIGASGNVAQLTRDLAAELDVPAAEMAEAVNGTVTRWVEDGLFLTARRPFPDPVDYQMPVDPKKKAYALGSRTVEILSEDAELLDDLDRALAPMALGAPGPDTAPECLEVIVREGYGLFRGGEPIWGAAGYELTRFHLLREIMDILCGPERTGAHLHASAVALGGRGLVIAGASGSGKSTLAAMLLGEGAALASDDHVAIDTTGHALLAFPTTSNLKPGSLAIPEVAKAMAERGQSGKARVPVGTPLQLAGFVFPRYAPDAANTLTPVAPDEALRRLIQTGSRVSRHTLTAAPLVTALKTHPAFDLTYRDSDFALGKCRALLSP